MNKFRLFHRQAVPVVVLSASCWMVAGAWFLAQAQDDSSLLAQPAEQFNIYCEYNGGGTGDCSRLDSNEVISCAFASQDFIQCRSKKGYLATCLYFSPNQFACRKIRGARLNPQGSCENPMDKSSTCRPPIREKFTNPLTPLPQPNDGGNLMPLPNQNDLQDPFKNTL